MVDLRPMLATPSTGAGGKRAIDISTLDGNFIFDLKMDGVRAFLRWDGTRCIITNRNQVDITWRFPEIAVAAQEHFDLPVWLDGEIVCNTGRFEDTLTRDKQSNPASALAYSQSLPATFHAFDRPDYATEVWVQRRNALDTFLSELPAGLPFMATTWAVSHTFLDRTREAGLEGVIAKNVHITYQFGARSKSWIKFKNLHRVTCLVAGYEPGTGARSHFGKMNLALIDTNGSVVPCGSVGTGFTMREIVDLKERLDRHEILVVEIECLHVTSGGTLRFPVYKGIRSDLEPMSCLASQLESIPKC